ncbi:MAG: UDP-3-O-(3-hydroxymyristoyl)glucosamine N-acyltransferase [Deltaproteobacteria bacterium]|nr:UDP-3-O-(3-hydroxymyristoyl)glucosamine N-acyltransferase [Deltaproteobacteria bacterium]
MKREGTKNAHKIMKAYTVEVIKPYLDHYQILGNEQGKVFTHAKPIFEADRNALVWISPHRKDKQQIVEQTDAEIIISDSSIMFTAELIKRKCFIVVDEPRLTFLRIVNFLFSTKPQYGIHPTAYIHPDAIIHQDTYIGAFCYIGKCIIAEGTVIYGHCYLYDDVCIGKNVIIHAGCVIGADGFGYHRNDLNEFEKFPHLGGVVIEDNVEIGANTCIDRGGLGNTIIKEGTKIDNLVHISHNVVVGKHVAIPANTMLAGSCVIGDYTWISPSVALKDGLTIGSHSTVGIGSIVLRNVPDGETWIGNPAKEVHKFVRIQQKLTQISNIDAYVNTEISSKNEDTLA